MASELTRRIIEMIRSIPEGSILSYGEVALLAGHPRGRGGAREVVRVLARCSERENLPWWRVVRKDGSIALGEGQGRELQIALLAREGITVNSRGVVERSCFSPSSS
ncbi:MAG: MGMT family protein [Spirochaetales bacterium]|nr:MGMT family protein [Spirochaetales bacterium]